MDMAEISSLLALTLGTDFASGINLYATVCALGLAGALGYTEIPKWRCHREAPAF